MKKILFFVDDYGGGAGNVVQILANEFEKNSDFVPVVAVLNPHSPKYKLSPTINVVEYTMSQNKSKNKLLFLWRNLSSVKSIVNEISPDVIISFLDNINTNVCLSQLFNRKIKIIVSERSNPLAIKPYGLYRYLRPLAYARADIITVQCDYFKNFMPYFKHKMVVTPNPVVKPSISKDDYNLHKPIRFISCARLSSVKQLDIMISKFYEIHKKFQDSQLTIFGEGSERARLENLIQNYSLQNCVFLPGASQKVYEELAQADIYLMTSAQEGFPNALCEAMAIGLPVVAYECHHGIGEIIQTGVNGLTVNSLNNDEIADAVSSIINDDSLRAKIGISAKDISNTFSISEISNLWGKLLKS